MHYMYAHIHYVFSYQVKTVHPLLFFRGCNPAYTLPGRLVVVVYRRGRSWWNAIAGGCKCSGVEEGGCVTYHVAQLEFILNLRLAGV